MKYLAIGRIHPERTYVSFGPVHWRVGNSNQITAYSDSAQLSVALDVADLTDVASAHIAAEHFAHIAVSSLGFSLGSAYSVEITQVFDENQTPHVFGVRHQELMYDPHIAIFNRAIVQATEDIFFRLALRDYVRAIADTTDCATYCYRAIEAIKSSFVFRTKEEGWAPMHAALGTDRRTIEDAIKSYADPIRHGNWISAKSTNGEIRTAMLKLTRNVLESYLDNVRPAA